MADNKQPQILTADAQALRQAVALLRSGALVAVPTETVYGLAARADSDTAVAAIYRAKGRPDFNPLIVHVRDLAAAERLACFDDRARALAVAFWPGALTLVLPLRAGAGLAAAVTAGLPTLALRCPAHPVMQDLLAGTGLPLAAPSANRSGGVSPTTAAHVAASLRGGVELILDGGACEQGIESTIVALRDKRRWQVLRPGPIGPDRLARVLGTNRVTGGHSASSVEAPGQLASHYAPGKPMRLGALNANLDEFHIGFGDVAGHINLSAGGDPAEAASRLYACLHAAADSDLHRIAVAPVPDSAIGEAINDRLRRAAA